MQLRVNTAPGRPNGTPDNPLVGPHGIPLLADVPPDAVLSDWKYSGYDGRGAPTFFGTDMNGKSPTLAFPETIETPGDMEISVLATQPGELGAKELVVTVAYIPGEPHLELFADNGIVIAGQENSLRLTADGLVPGEQYDVIVHVMGPTGQRDKIVREFSGDSDDRQILWTPNDGIGVYKLRAYVTEDAMKTVDADEYRQSGTFEFDVGG